MRTFLALHGGLVGWGAILLGAAAGWLAVAAAWRWGERRAALRRLALLPGAVGTELAEGPGVIRGTLRASSERPALVTITAGDEAARSSERATRLWVETADGVEVEVVGAARVVSAPESGCARSVAPTLRAELEQRLSPEELWPFDALPVEVRTLHDGDAVHAFGQLERVADAAAGYREAASKLTVAGLDPAGVAVVGTQRSLPWRRTRWAAPIGALLVMTMFGVAPLSSGSSPALVSPFHRPSALRALRGRLRVAAHSGQLSDQDGELRLALLGRYDLMERARTLRAMGRDAAAVALFRDGYRDPLVRARRLHEQGYVEEARAELAQSRGAEAREEELRQLLPTRSPRDVDAGRFERLLRDVCGDDLGCATTPALLSVNDNLPLEYFDALDVLFSDRPVHMERIELMLRLAEAAEPAPPRIVTARVEWRLELASAQLQLGAVDQAWDTLERARRESRGRDSWLVHRLRELRNVAHVRDGAPHQASAANSPLADLIVIAIGREWRDWPSITAGPLGIGPRLEAAREQRPVLYVHPDTAAEMEALVWYGRYLPVGRRQAQSQILLGRARPLGDASDLVYETSRARALRALGAGSWAAGIEERVRQRRVALYGW